MRAQAAWLKRLFKNIPSGPCSLCRGSLEASHAAICAACSDALPWMHNSCQRCALPLENAQLCIACAAAPPPYERRTAALRALHRRSSLPPADELLDRRRKTRCLSRRSPANSRCSVPAYFTALIDDAYPIYWCPCHCTGRSSFAAVLTNANFSVAT